MPSLAAVLPTFRPPDRSSAVNLFGRSGADRCATPLSTLCIIHSDVTSQFIKQASSPLTCRC